MDRICVADLFDWNLRLFGSTNKGILRALLHSPTVNSSRVLYYMDSGTGAGEYVSNCHSFYFL